MNHKRVRELKDEIESAIADDQILRIIILLSIISRNFLVFRIRFAHADDGIL